MSVWRAACSECGQEVFANSRAESQAQAVGHQINTGHIPVVSDEAALDDMTDTKVGYITLSGWESTAYIHTDNRDGTGEGRDKYTEQPVTVRFRVPGPHVEMA